MSKADRLKASASFSSAARTPSTRRQLIARATGEAPADPTRVPLADLVGNPDNPREELGDLQELAQSLLKHGLRQPVSVMPRRAFLELCPQHEQALGEAAFVVINGNRRLAAARLAKLETLAVHISGPVGDDLASMRAAVLVENIHRKDLEPLEEARSVAELVELHGTQSEAAEHVGKSQGWVSQRLSLLNLTPELQTRLASGELRVREARWLARLEPQEQLAAWERNEHTAVNGNRPASAPSPAPVQDSKAPKQATQQSASSQRTQVEPGRGVPASDRGPAQLTLDLQWEADVAATEIVTVYGRERAEKLASAILEQL
ncbi:ParB/RepB/Spo0J family partition protein [Nocardiopsis dassonvillei]|uniref:ParB/RepB/Spo0J family partition protein n=1 Tax=Nocardiopsis dassonvillei TaxID=2014 RepID=UPI0033E8C0AE